MSEEVTLAGQPGLVFGPGPEGWWDSERVSGPQVIREHDGTWKMWYYGRDVTFDRMVNLQSGRCGMAVSKDGVTWERVRGPLTMGAVLDPVPSNVDRFDNAHIGVSGIHYENGLYWMWYFGGDRTTLEFSTFVGTQKIKGIHIRPGCAIFRDGLNWTRLNGPYRGTFLDLGGQDDWDAQATGTPHIVPMPDGSYRMYYIGGQEGGGGELGTKAQIGMAVSDGPNFRKWRRWVE